MIHRPPLHDESIWKKVSRHIVVGIAIATCVAVIFFALALVFIQSVGQ